MKRTIEDLKNDFCKRLTENTSDSKDKQTIKESLCFLYANEFANGCKVVYIYISDIDDNEVQFNVEYNLSYSIGEEHDGYCFLDMKEVLKAYGFSDFESLKNYYYKKYNNDRQVWKKIVEELRQKNLNPTVDENELSTFDDGSFIMSNL